LLSQYNLLNQNHEKISFILSILLCSTAAFAQENDSFGGTKKCYFLNRDLSVIGITYERIVSEYVSLEVGVGLPSIGIGAKIFAKSKSKNDVNTGLTATYVDFGGIFYWKWCDYLCSNRT
jgi:hypothetical protein